MDKSLNRFSDDPTLNMMAGDILAERGDYDQALDHYQRVIQTDPDSPRAHLLCGVIYEHLKQYYLARDMYQKVIQIEPSNPLGQHYFAGVNILTGKLKDAKNHLKLALELRPNLLESREFLAWVWEKEGNKEEAAKEYEILMKLDLWSPAIHLFGTNIQSSVIASLAFLVTDS